MILRPVELFRIRFQSLKQGLTDGKHVADIVVISEQIDIEIRFKERLR